MTTKQARWWSRAGLQSAVGAGCWILLQATGIAQGTFVFGNRVLPLVEARVFATDGVTPLAGSGYLAQAFVKLASSPESGFIPAGNAVPFRTGAAAGYIQPDNLVLTFASGTLLTVEMRAWDTSGGPSYELARAAGVPTGRSNPVTLALTTAPATPPAMVGLQAFSLEGPSVPPPGQGVITVREFRDIGGGRLVSDLTASAKFPDAPDTVSHATYFEWPQATPPNLDILPPADVGNNYGVQMIGYFHPPVSGAYVFRLAADDNAALYLSTDEDPAHKRLIAIEPLWNPPRAFDTRDRRDPLNPENDSQTYLGTEWPERDLGSGGAVIVLQAGRRYYIEALLKEGSVAENLAVAVVDPQLEIDPNRPIPGGYLSSIDKTSGPVVITRQPQSQSVPEGTPVTFTVEANGTPPYAYQWRRNGFAIPGATGRVYRLAAVTLADDGARFSVLVSGAVGSVFSTEATLSVRPDITRPTVVHACGGADLSSVTITFSEPLDAASASTPGNYFVPGLAVTAAMLTGPTTVRLSTSPQVRDQTYSLILNNLRDRASSPNPITPNTTLAFSTLPVGVGWVSYERWHNENGNLESLDGFALAIATGNLRPPDHYEPVAQFGAPWQARDEYYGRVSGFFIPPATGNYVFFLSSDDESALYLSPDGNPANKRLIALETVWSSRYEFTASSGGSDPSSKRSDLFPGSEWPEAPLIFLEAGHRYFLEALFAEGAGEDGLDVTFIHEGEPDPPNDATALRLTGNRVASHLPCGAAGSALFTDAFEGRGTVRSPRGELFGGNFDNTLQVGEPLIAGQHGGASGWIAWQAPFTGVVSFTTAGSGVDTLLAAYGGTALTNLVPLAANDDAAPDGTSRIRFNAVAGSTYAITVDGFNEARGRIRLAWGDESSAGGSLPTLVLQRDPPTPSVLPGSTVVLDVEVESSGGDDVLNLEWFRNGEPLTNISGTTLTLSNVTRFDVGGYVVRATTGSKDGTNVHYLGPAIVQINTAGETDVAAVDKFGERPSSFSRSAAHLAGANAGRDAIRLTSGSGAAPASGFSGSQIFDSSCVNSKSSPCGGATADACEGGAASMWFDYQAPADGRLLLVTTQATFSNRVALYTGGVLCFLTSVQPQTYAEVGLGVEATYLVTQGTTYSIAISGIDGATGTVEVEYELDVNDPPTLAAIAAPPAIRVNAGAQTIDIQGISAGGGESQRLRVSATSDNPKLIPNPTVTYANPDATGRLTYTPVAGGSGSSVITVTVRDAGFDGAEDGTDDAVVQQQFKVEVRAVVVEPSFQQETGAWGLTAIEAEHHALLVPRGTHAWRLQSLVGASGKLAMTAGPNSGTLVDTGFAEQSPRLDLGVNFVRTGLHYVWVRGWAQTAGDDSVHVGLDGLPEPTADRVSRFNLGEWSWSRTTMDAGAKATLNVTAPGRHRINLWMREDGFVLDKVVLTPDTMWEPQGEGPAGSALAEQRALVPFQQAGGFVLVEAEHYSRRVDRSVHRWRPRYTRGASGLMAMAAEPNAGSSANEDYERESPRLDFEVNFERAGLHYVWARGFGATPGDDSLHVGLDGEARASGARLAGFVTGQWSWAGKITDGWARATLSVGAPGVHTVNVWMREDGFIFDELLLTTNGAFVPTGEGPAESTAMDVPLPFQQEGDPDSLVSMEAVHYAVVVDREDQAWRMQASADGSGRLVMTAGPNRNKLVDTEYAEHSPRLDLLVNFVKTGPHYLWVRGWAASAGDDSVHAGLDGEPQQTAERIVGFGKNQWNWSRTTTGVQKVAILNVTTPGVHAVNLWMREDGFELAKVVMTTSAAWVPVGEGPPESALAAQTASGPFQATRGELAMSAAPDSGQLVTAAGVARIRQDFNVDLSSRALSLRFEAVTRRADGVLVLSVAGTPETPFRIEASDDLNTWTIIDEGVFGSAPRPWVAPRNAPLSKRFYRLVQE